MALLLPKNCITTNSLILRGLLGLRPEMKRSLLFTSFQSRLTSTTTTSKGQAISLSNANDASIEFNPPKEKPFLDLSFQDSKTAFKSKSNLDLLRGYLVFQLCSINFIVNNQKQVRIQKIILFS